MESARILLRHAFSHPRRDNMRRRTFALAASIFITTLLGGVLLWSEPKSTLENDVFVHIDETSYALKSTTILDDNTNAGKHGRLSGAPLPTTRKCRAKRLRLRLSVDSLVSSHRMSGLAIQVAWGQPT